MNKKIDKPSEKDFNNPYEFGFETEIDTVFAPKGLNEDVIRFISDKKEEPKWLLDWRLDAFSRWLKMEEPNWSSLRYPKIDYQDAYYFSAPKETEKPKSLDEVDPKLIETYNKLGIPLKEQEWLAGVAVDAVFDSITSSLQGGGEVRLVGFGTFSVANRKASTGRNPRTGEAIQIPASKQPKFKAGKGLKDAVN